MKVIQPYVEPVEVPALGRRWVQPGAVVVIPGPDLASFLEAGWIPADEQTRAAGQALLDERRISRLAVRGVVGETDGESVESEGAQE